MNDLLARIDVLVESQQRLAEAIERQADAIADLIDSMSQQDCGSQSINPIRLLDEL